MNHTRKISIALVIMMILMITLAVIPTSAANMTGGEKLYLVPNSNWNQSNARFAAYFFGDGEAWVSMTKVAGESNLYEVTVPAGNWTNVIFCRMNPSAAANNWNNKWNQTADLEYNGTSNCYTVKESTWDSGGGTWSTYGNTCAHANVGAEATCTTPQECLDCGDPVVSALGHTFNASHLCTRCNEQAAFTVAGSGAHLGTEWDTGNVANDMTYADGTYTKVYTNVAAGSYLLKVVRDHAWGTAYPEADKAYTVTTDGSTVTVTLKGTEVTITIDAPHVHVWSDATCTDPQKCECNETQGEALGHNFVEGVCSVCEAKDPDYVAPHEHNYVNGECECGEKDPNYVAPEAKSVVNVSDLTIETTTDAELVAGTGIYAAAGLAIDGNKKSIDGFDFTKRLKLGGTMTAEGKFVKIVTDGASKIVVYAIASSSSATDRYLQIATIADGALNVLATTETAVDGGAIAKYEFTVSKAGTYYLGSNNSGINLYYIAVEAAEVEAPHVHDFVEGKCDCGEVDPNYVPPHEHNFVEGKCECGEEDPNYVPPHEHNFVEGKCECGEVDPNYEPPHEHNFVEGKCECGEVDPNYVPETPEEPGDEPETPEEPGDETPEEPSDEPTEEPEAPAEPKLNFFQKIWKAILDFFQKLFGKK